MHVYTPADGDRLQALLDRHGVRSKLIGTLPSDHDIDIVIDATSVPASADSIANWLTKVLKARRVIHTDIGSYFFLSSLFGHVDVFFQDPERCSQCGARVLRKHRGVKP